MTTTIPERLMRVETKLEHVETLLEKISTTQDVIKAKVTRAETQVTTGAQLVKWAYPPASMAGLWFLSHFGLIPLPR